MYRFWDWINIFGSPPLDLLSYKNRAIKFSSWYRFAAVHFNTFFGYFHVFARLCSARSALPLTHSLSSCPQDTLALYTMSGTEISTLTLFFSLPPPSLYGCQSGLWPVRQAVGCDGRPRLLPQPPPLLYFPHPTWPGTHHRPSGESCQRPPSRALHSPPASNVPNNCGLFLFSVKHLVWTFCVIYTIGLH